MLSSLRLPDGDLLKSDAEAEVGEYNEDEDDDDNDNDDEADDDPKVGISNIVIGIANVYLIHIYKRDTFGRQCA